MGIGGSLGGVGCEHSDRPSRGWWYPGAGQNVSGYPPKSAPNVTRFSPQPNISGSDLGVAMSDRLALRRVCPGCSRDFVVLRKDHRTCSATCRKRVARARKAADKAQNVPKRDGTPPKRASEPVRDFDGPRVAYLLNDDDQVGWYDV